jgi:hypothetical protein
VVIDGGNGGVEIAGEAVELDDLQQGFADVEDDEGMLVENDCDG